VACGKAEANVAAAAVFRPGRRPDCDSIVKQPACARARVNARVVCRGAGFAWLCRWISVTSRQERVWRAERRCHSLCVRILFDQDAPRLTARHEAAFFLKSAGPLSRKKLQN